MGNLIGKGKFPDKIILNDTEIVRTDFPKNVSSIPTQLNMEDAAEKELMDFQEAIIKVIDAIIDEGIEDYLKVKGDKLENEEETDIEKRNLLQETTEIWDEMFIKSQAIEDAIDYVGNDEQVSIEFKPEYILGAIEGLLNTYRNRVFKKLIRNEKRFRNNH
ncbi:MAG: hypothetical protein PHV23_00785 [Candidatus Gracilibacteria bacterium]|nr:hypothetical protein [Candidatus Gracilibacteria bacterium]